jgi:multiple sugar transport system permease protein
MEFNGLGNFFSLFNDEVFVAGLKSSFIWTAGNLILQLSIPLGLALLLDRKFRGELLVKSLILVPWITPLVGIAMMTKWLLEPELGLFNRILLQIGIIQQPLNLLGSPVLALPTLIIINSWQFIPFGTLLMLAALQTIPKSIYDASRVDGANYWQTFKYMIYPMISSMIGFVFFLAFAWNFNTFGLIWITTEGGPLDSTGILPVLIYRRAFRGFNMGESAAIATMIGFFLIIVGILFFKYLWKRDLYYENKEK